MTGKLAMEETGSWMVSTYYQSLGAKVDVVQMPKGKQSGTETNGLAFVIAKQTKNPDAAWAFTKFTATKDAQISTAKVVIPAYTGASDAWIALYPSMNLKAFIDSLAFAKTQDHWAKNNTEVVKAYTDCLATINISADTNIKQILTDTQTKMQGLLK
jgi:ABC-type glycerol-3-phosphate transport system substrate-binding protein